MITPHSFLSRLAALAVAAIGIAAVPSAGAASTVWESALALYSFSQDLNDSNGGSNGVGWRLTGDSAEPASYTDAGPSDLPGWDGWALSLSDTRYVNLGQGEENAFQITGSLTLFARVYIEAAGASAAIISKDAANGNRSYALRLDDLSETGGTLAARFNGSKSISFTSPEIRTGVWLDVVVVYDAGQSIELFLNGVSVGKETSGIPTSLIPNAATPLLLGAQPFGTPIGSSNWTGLMERAAIWNMALTGDEVRSLSVIPEPGAAGLLSGLVVVMGGLQLRRRFRKA